MYELADISTFNAISGQNGSNTSALPRFQSGRNEAIRGLNGITSSLSRFYGKLSEANKLAPGLEGTKELRQKVRQVVDSVDREMRQYKAKWHSQGLFDDPQFKKVYKEASRARANLVNLYNSIVAPESSSKGFWSNKKSIGEGAKYTQADLDIMKAKTKMVAAVSGLVRANHDFDAWYRNACEYRKNVLKACEESGSDSLRKPSLDLFKKLGSYKMFGGPHKTNGVLQWEKHSSWYQKAVASINEIERTLAQLKKNGTVPQQTPAPQAPVAPKPTVANINPEDSPEFYSD